jgi:Icc-related predicted phosphoesterase
LIGWSKKQWRRFRPEEALLSHTTSRIFLNTTLAVPFAGPTVVITHHGVHWGSVHSQFKRDMLIPAYVSDLSDTIEAHQPTLWVHGHVHTSFDYRVGETRIVCNAHGYGDENPDFDGRLVVEVNS